MTLRQILQRREAIRIELRQLHSAANGGELAGEAQARWTALTSEAGLLEAAEQRQAAIDALDRAAAGTALAGSGDLALDREAGRVTLLGAIRSQLGGTDMEAGRAREISAELARRSGKQPGGIFVPYSVFQRPASEQRVVGTTIPAGGPGGNLIATTLDGANMIDILRAKLTIRQLGARIITGLTSNVDIPRLKASATTGWVAENTALTASDQQFDKVSLRPKHVGGIVELSRNMIQQTSMEVEQIVQNDFALLLAQAIDSAAINGAGGNAPTGIFNTSGVGSSSAVAANAKDGLTFSQVAALISTVDSSNVDTDSRAFLTNTIVKGLALKLQDGYGRPIGIPLAFLNENVAFTTLVPSNFTNGTATGCSGALYGNWSDLLLAFWSEIDILVNPYESSAYPKGNVQIRAMATADIEVRRPESFAKWTSI